MLGHWLDAGSLVTAVGRDEQEITAKLHIVCLTLPCRSAIEENIQHLETFPTFSSLRQFH